MPTSLFQQWKRDPGCRLILFALVAVTAVNILLRFNMRVPLEGDLGRPGGMFNDESAPPEDAGYIHQDWGPNNPDFESPQHLGGIFDEGGPNHDKMDPYEVLPNDGDYEWQLGEQNITDFTGLLSVRQGYVLVDGEKVFYQEMGQIFTRQVFMLHGARHASQEWLHLGIMTEFGHNRYHVVAVDMPGYGKSSRDAARTPPAEYLKRLISAIGMERPVVISPTASGRLSIPFILENPEKSIRGLVAISPVLGDYESANFSKVHIPTLNLFGEYDVTGRETAQVLSKIPNSEVDTITDGGADCFEDNPLEFQERILRFMALECFEGE